MNCDGDPFLLLEAFATPLVYEGDAKNEVNDTGDDVQLMLLLFSGFLFDRLDMVDQGASANTVVCLILEIAHVR